VVDEGVDVLVDEPEIGGLFVEVAVRA